MKPAFLDHLPPRGRKVLFCLAGAFIVYSLAGFFLLPWIIKWQMVKRLPDITKRQTAVRQVKFNPWTFSLTIRGLALNEPDGRPFASWDELFVNFQASSLFRWAWTFDEIRLEKPFGEIMLLPDGRLNFANMLAAPTKAPPKPSEPSSIVRLNIYRLEITNGFVRFEDRTRQTVFRTEYRPINLHLREFTTRPDVNTPYSFRAESDAGRSLTWAGDLTVQPLRSSGHFEITAVQLPRYRPYLEDFTRAVLTNGLADVQFNYHFAADTNGFSLVVTNATLQVAQVQLLDPDTGETVAGLQGFEVQQAGFNWTERSVRLDTVKVSEGVILARLKPNGRLNWLDLITPPVAPTNPAPKAVSADAPFPPWVVSVGQFNLEQTAVRFEDLTQRTPFKTELKPIEISVTNFTTRAEVDAHYSFQVATEATETVAGKGTFSINPVRSTGEIEVRAVDVKKYLPYAEPFFRGRITDGKIEAQIPYRVAMDTNGLRAGVTNLAVKLTAFEVLMPENSEQVTHVKEIGFSQVEASLEDRRGRVGLFKGDGASVLLRRHKDGSLNLLGLLALSKTNTPAVASAPTETPPDGATNAPAFALGGWTLNIDEIQLDNYTLKIEDHTPAQPALFLFDQLALNLKGVSSAFQNPINANVAFRLNEAGAVTVRGQAVLAPAFAEMDVTVTNLDLRLGQPYVEPFAALGLVSGALSTAVKIRFQTNDPAAPLLTLTGGVRVTNLVTTDQVGFKEFLRWDDLAVNGIDTTLAPNRVKIEEIRWVRPQASLLIGTNQKPNLALILRKEAATNKVPVATPPSASATTNSSVELFPVQLSTLVLDHASFAFADESVKPPVALGLEELSGTVKGLSSALNTPANVDLAGKVDAQSPFSVRGRVNPFPAAFLVDLTIANANTQLTPLTGYLEKYAGYPLNKGRLSTSLRYRIDGKQLEAENKIQLDQLTLGTFNNNPDAPKLPIKLGLALLKDNNGRIDLEVPVKGSLDDPEFKLGPIIMKVVLNLIIKAAASPFKLLGSLVGGGEELSYVEFTAGTTNLVDGELDKLTKLAAALAKRPALNLEIEGAIHPELDRDALARQKLAEQLKTKRLQELAAKSRAPESIATFQLEAEERERLLRAAFVEQFGTNIAAIIQTNLARFSETNTPTTLAAPSQSKTKGSLWQRFKSVFARSSVEKTKSGKRLPKADRQALSLATPELMEELLAETLPVTSENFRELMTARSRWVQDWLVQHGQVAPDRLFLVAPKPVEANYQGECRAVLSVN